MHDLFMILKGFPFLGHPVTGLGVSWQKKRAAHA